MLPNWYGSVILAGCEATLQIRQVSCLKSSHFFHTDSFSPFPACIGGLAQSYGRWSKGGSKEVIQKDDFGAVGGRKGTKGRLKVISLLNRALDSSKHISLEVSIFPCSFQKGGKKSPC